MNLRWHRDEFRNERHITFTVSTDDLLMMPRPTYQQERRFASFADEGLPISERLAIAAEFARHVESGIPDAPTEDPR